MVGQDEDFTQERLAVTPWKRRMQIAGRIVQHRFENSQIILECPNRLSPLAWMFGLGGSGPVAVRPCGRDVVRRLAEEHNIVLGDAHVLEEFPGGMRRAGRAESDSVRWKTGHRIDEGGVGVTCAQQVNELRA